MLFQKGYPGIKLPTGPPNNLRLVIPPEWGPDWQSAADVIEGLLWRKGLRYRLMKMVWEMPATLYSSAYLTHPLFPKDFWLPLGWGDTDEDFVKRLSGYLGIARLYDRHP